MKRLLPSLFALAAMLITNALHAAPGDVYEADFGSGTIFKFSPNGTKTTFATGFTSPVPVAFDATGNLFVAGGDILKITPSGSKTTFATGLNNPKGLAFDGTGNLFVTENDTGMISKVTPNGTRTTFASGLSRPDGLAFDGNGNLFVSESFGGKVSKFTPSKIKSTFASGLGYPLGITFDGSGNLYVVDSNNNGNFLYKFNSDGTSKTTFATLPATCFSITYENLFGDFYLSVLGNNNSIIKVDKNGSQSTFASNLNQPAGLAIEPVTPAPGIVYVTSQDTNSIDLINANSRNSTFTAQGGLVGPYALAFDSKGNLFVGNAGATTIVKVSPSGVQTTFATTTGATTAIAIDNADNLFEGEGNTINKLTASGTRTTFGTTVDLVGGLAFDSSGNLFASTNKLGNSGATSSIIKFTPAGAQTTFATGLNQPVGLAFNGSGDLFVAEYGANRILRFTPDATKTIFASNLSGPGALAFDAAGNLYAGDFLSGSVFKFAPNGFKITFALETHPGGIAVEKPTGRPLNIATRLKVQTGDNVLIAGFIITGTETKNVLIRGIGPSLSNFGVPGALQDPTLEVYTGATKLSTNDNWKIYEATGASQEAAIQSTGIPPTNDRESAIDIHLPPGAYTAILRGKNNTAGVGSVELYDLSQTSSLSNVANISTRGFVDTGDNAMIGGFIIGSGDGYGKVIIRAIGPSLAAVGVSNSLADPFLELHNASGTLIDRNDDWKIGNQAAIQATGLAPANDRESAIVTTLPAGSYTAIMKGFNGGTGVGLVEVYNLH